MVISPSVTQSVPPPSSEGGRVKVISPSVTASVTPPSSEGGTVKAPPHHRVTLAWQC